MCGIYLKICRYESCCVGPFNESHLISISKRGPDSLVTKEYRRTFMAFSRLAIRDLQFGNQPYRFREWTTIINGELDNFNSLHAELGYSGDRSLIPSGDMQILGHAFSLFKNKALRYSKGFFAGVAINTQTKNIYIFRDRVGEKPLFYCIDDSHLVISSDPHNTEGLPTIEIDLMRKFLARGHNLKGETIFKFIKKVIPGELIELDLNTWNYKSEFYWSWESYERQTGRVKGTSKSSNIGVFRKRLEVKLSEAIESQLNNDVETGILLSGGIDSTLITYLANRDKERKIPAYSLGFTARSYDESEKAAKIAILLGIPHLIFRPDDKEFLESLPDVLDAMREPILDTATISLFLLSKFVSRDLRVVLSGDGGDELLRGYEIYDKLKIVNLMEKLFTPFPKLNYALKWGLPALQFFSSGRYNSIAMKAERVISILENRNVQSAVVAISPIAGIKELKMLYKDLDGEVGSSKWLTLEQIDKVYREYVLPDVYLSKSDRMSMFHGLEIRSPFLSPSIIELTKEYDEILRDISKEDILLPILPQEIQKLLVNSKKHGFAPPLKDYFAGFNVSNRLCKVLEINEKELSKIKFRAVKGEQNAVIAFWAILVLDYFMNRNL